MEVKRISVVLVCDNNYVVLLAALLKSIEMNHKDDSIIDVYIVDDQIQKKNKAKIEQSLALKKMNLIWLKMNSIIPKDIQLPIVNNGYPINTYIRLLIPYFIPKEIEKVIFMDVDMIMIDDISNLLKIDIGDYVIGAASDSMGEMVTTIGNKIENYKELGLDPNEGYFNAGLQIINTKKWLEQDITIKTISVINENKKYAYLGDQYGLNVALVGNWYEIDRLWNCFSVNDDPNPKVIHYFHRKPIFKSYAYNYKEEFYYYLDQTKWKGFKQIGASSRYFKKIINIIEKLKFKFFK